MIILIMLCDSHIKYFKKDLNNFFDDLLLGLNEPIIFSDEATESIFKTLEYKINEYKNMVGL